jgi:hypothetical protein
MKFLIGLILFLVVWLIGKAIATIILKVVFWYRKRMDAKVKVSPAQSFNHKPITKQRKSKPNKK